MKKLLTALFGGILAVTAMAQDPSQFLYVFDNPEFTPAQGTVESISTVRATFPQMYSFNFAKKSDVTLTKDGVVQTWTTLKAGINSCVMNFATPLTEPGTYTLTIPAGSIKDEFDGSFELTNPNTITASWTIGGSSEPTIFFDKFTRFPTAPTQTSLETITFTFPNVNIVEVENEDGVTVTCDGEPVALKSVTASGNVVSVNLASVQTTGGAYVVTIPANALRGYNADKTETIFNDQAFTATYNINYTVDFSSAYFTPSGTVESLKEITLNLPGVKYPLWQQPRRMVFTKDGQAIPGFYDNYDKGEYYMTIILEEEQTEPGEYTLTIPAQVISGRISDGDVEYNEDAIVGKWTIAGEVDPNTVANFSDYTVSPKVGTVTELKDVTFTFPNCAKIEIVEAYGIYASLKGSDINTTCKAEGNTLTISLPSAYTSAGDYEFFIGEECIKAISADGSKSMLNGSFISADYTIEGAALAEFSFDGYTCNPAEGNVTSLKTINITFPNIYEVCKETGAKATIMKGAYAPTTISFKENGNNTITLNLANEITTAGNYVVTIDAGALCGFNEDYDYINNDVITLNYTVGQMVGVEGIDADAENAVIYNLQGIRVDADKATLPAGLYIINGRKQHIR